MSRYLSLNGAFQSSKDPVVLPDMSILQYNLITCMKWESVTRWYFKVEIALEVKTGQRQSVHCVIEHPLNGDRKIESAEGKKTFCFL